MSVRKNQSREENEQLNSFKENLFGNLKSKTGSLKSAVESLDPAKNHLSPEQRQDDVGKQKKRGSLTSMASMSINVNKNIANVMYASEKRAEEEQEIFLEQAPKFIIHPYSNFRIFWDIMTFALVTINIIIIPLNISFYSDSGTFNTLFLISDIWFLTDILLNLRTGVVLDDVEMEVVFDPVEIRKFYVKSWFFIDLISSIPWDVMVSTFGGGIDEPTDGTDRPQFESTDTLKAARFLKFVTILKLLRVTRLAKALRNWEELLNFQYNISNELVLKVIKLAIMIFAVIHFNGCILFMVPMFMDFPEEDEGRIRGPCWVRLRGLIDEEPLTQYSWSIFKAASHMLCIGYGQAPPLCLVDMIMTVISMLIGSVVFALTIAEITSLIQSMNSSASSYKEKLTQVKEYMDFCKVPQHLRNRIREYYEVKFQGKMFNEHAILNELNPLLREKVINYNCRSLVKSVDFLNAADTDFVSDLIAKLKFEVYLQADEIIREGSVGSHMYFINSGTVQVTTKNGMKPRYLSEGEHFGEICLFVSNLKRTASIIATTNVSVYILSADDFNQTLKWYPSEKVEMQRVAIERMEILLLQSRYKRQNGQRKGTLGQEDADLAGGILDEDIYKELEAQRDALLNLHKRQEEAENEKKEGDDKPDKNSLLVSPFK